MHHSPTCLRTTTATVLFNKAGLRISPKTSEVECPGEIVNCGITDRLLSSGAPPFPLTIVMGTSAQPRGEGRAESENPSDALSSVLAPVHPRWRHLLASYFLFYARHTSTHRLLQPQPPAVAPRRVSSESVCVLIQPESISPLLCLGNTACALVHRSPGQVEMRCLGFRLRRSLPLRTTT